MSSSPKRRKHNWFAMNKNSEVPMNTDQVKLLKTHIVVEQRRMQKCGSTGLATLWANALKYIEQLEIQSQPRNTPILMSATNPNGWTLEDIALQLASEMIDKDMNIQGDKRPQVIETSKLNKEIIDLLHDVRVKQQQTRALFAELGPDQGPTGKPRAGAGHE
ncbi:hypothetical protein [Pseudoalteromonas shioyasakiensis]|uniref:hypothetical protein n=1 Tax=Pseudoalteromonas shioyasakiensis TaxID=1190813 RepID=UPI00078239AD|nr:hypothetical protein [Pseudoalteromonas shioyasakiensis]